MTGAKDTRDDAALDALFDAARAARPAPSSELLARINADAQAAQPQELLNVTTVPAAPRKGIVTQLLDALGGWPTIGGLATAAVAGVYIGFAQPELVGFNEQITEYADYTDSSLWSDDDLVFEEG